MSTESELVLQILAPRTLRKKRSEADTEAEQGRADAVASALLDVTLGVMVGRNPRLATELLISDSLVLESELLYEKMALLLAAVPAARVYPIIQELFVGGELTNEQIYKLAAFVGLPKKTVQNNTNRDGDVRGALLSVLVEKKFESIMAVVQRRLEAGAAESLETLLVMFMRDRAMEAIALTGRGSHKSTNGKRHERGVLGAVLRLRGLRQVRYDATTPPVVGTFWLTSEAAGERETDATVVISNSLLVKFDIGFIGAGNPEIANDKLDRHARSATLFGKKYNVKTIVIVDKLPTDSSVIDRAAKRSVVLLQMSNQNWLVGLFAKLTELGANVQPLLDVQEKWSSETTQDAMEALLATVIDADTMRDILRLAAPAVA